MPASRAALRRLRKALPPGSLITEPAALKPYETDGLTAFRELPWAVALPETEEQVQEVLRICRKHRLPLTPRGAGTGLSGGAQPVPGGLVLGLSKLNRILEIDLENCVARVQPGVRNLAVSEAAALHGLHYAPNPSSQTDCSIGGSIAENSGGAHCLKHGLTVHNLLGLKVLGIEGETLRLGGKGFDYPGFDLLALMCGSEGMLGLVVEASLRLLPQPPDKLALLAAFRSLSDAAAAATGIMRAGIVPAGLEMMDGLALRAAEDFAGAGYPRDAAAILLCELDGAKEELSALESSVLAILAEANAFRIRRTQNPEQQARLWSGRKAAFPAMGRIAPDCYCVDGAVPRRALADVVEGIAELSNRHGLAVANFLHAGDGNLHPFILYDGKQDGQSRRARELGGKILELCVAAGGTITGEHGVGAQKLDQMCLQFGPREIAQFERVKQVFDPQGLLNPGKGIPKPSRCVELGGMLAHAGKAPLRQNAAVLMRDSDLAGEFPAEADQTAKLVDALRDALARERPIRIVGAGSKPWSADNLDGKRLSLAGHVGIIDYRPEEQVLQARSGTPIDALSALLARHRQALPWEPPRFGGRGTLGGAIASGLAGPGRPWRGAVRDAVLGVEMLNGKGERLVFGGQVMKNVAGYDLSRLQAGAQGVLGLLLSVSVRLMPLPEAEATCILECDRTASQSLVRAWARLPLPVSATCFLDGRLHVRLSGADSSVAAAARKIGGERTDGASIWPQLRDRELPCFREREGATLWLVHCPPAADWPPGDCVVEWAGARRWWSTNLKARKVYASARSSAAAAWPASHPPAWDGPLAARLKRAFDPRNLLNPGLMRPRA